MGKISKLSTSQIELVVATGKEVGPNKAIVVLVGHGITVSSGMVYYWMKCAGVKGPVTRAPYAKRKPKTVVSIATEIAE